ncbi:MAG: hypothetical protein HYZ79_04525, partial [Candidatus Melainabacteria bacterium]|nr:hypothetical protein [Candidatus Melainabacteria bacterium]
LTATQFSSGYGRLATLSAARRINHDSPIRHESDLTRLVQSVPICAWFLKRPDLVPNGSLTLDVNNNLHVVNDPDALEEHIRTSYETLRELAPYKLPGDIDSIELLDVLYHALDKRVEEGISQYGHDFAVVLALNVPDIIHGLQEYASSNDLTLLEQRLLDDQDLLYPALEALDKLSQVNLPTLLDSRLAIGKAEKHLAEMNMVLRL